MTNYNYNHIITKLMNDHAWLRVPYWVPLTEEEREQSKKKSDKELDAKIKEIFKK